MRRRGPIDSASGLGVADHVCWSYDEPDELLDVDRLVSSGALQLLPPAHAGGDEAIAALCTVHPLRRDPHDLAT